MWNNNNFKRGCSALFLLNFNFNISNLFSDFIVVVTFIRDLLFNSKDIQHAPKDWIHLNRNFLIKATAEEANKYVRLERVNHLGFHTKINYDSNLNRKSSRKLLLNSRHFVLTFDIQRVLCNIKNSNLTTILIQCCVILINLRSSWIIWIQFRYWLLSVVNFSFSSIKKLHNFWLRLKGRQDNAFHSSS